MQDYILPIYLETKKNYRTIKLTYELLNSVLALKMPIHSAGQWILDNMYIVEQEYTVAIEGLKNIKENSLPYVKTDDAQRQFRASFMANEIVEKNAGIITDGIVSNYIKEFQKHSYVTFAELSLLPLMLRCALIKFIRKVSVNIFNAEMQKLKVEKRINKSISDSAKLVSARMDKLVSKMKIDLNQSNGIKTSNTAYIEYMAFRLKDMGRQGEKFFNELKEETNKIGFTIDEAIEKEHSEITTTTRLVGNGIISLKTVSSTNWSEVIVSINKIDQTLKEDYTNEYKKCDFKTKNRYRRNVIRLATKYKLSEMYVAKKAVECSEEYQKHVGHFLIGDDKKLLIKSMGKSTLGINIKEKIIKPIKPLMFILTISMIAFLISYSINTYVISHYALGFKIVIGILTFILGLEVADKLISYFVGKFVRPRILPRFNFAKTIDEEYSTLIAMPSVINSCQKLDKMIEKMEVTYLANRSENMYYMLLGDCTSNKKSAHIALDDDIVKYGKEKIEELNNKYPSDKKLFNFIYRKRVYSSSEECYMGWERKRGALAHLNKLILGKLTKQEIDKYIYLAHSDIPKVKYLITVDEDTTLSLNSAKELVAIISHPLNKPILTKDGRRVKSGYGLIQPAVGLDIESANRSIFSKVFGGFGGLDIYTNAISNLYQDVFKEAIFTGKGIYDIELFEQLMGDSMPENLILSHDLLEGSYMRTGLASDVEVQDGFPHNFIAYAKRNHRWYRGDMQIISWMLSPKSPLNLLSRWKIFDNLRRETLYIFAMLLIIITMFIPGTSFVYSCLFVFCVMNFGHILSTIDNLIFGKNEERKQKQYIPVIFGIRANLLKMVFNFITLPYQAWITLSAHITSLYRMFISKKHLLEWATAEAIEASAKEKPLYVYKNMWPNIVFGILLIVYSLLNEFPLVKDRYTFIFGIFFIIAPISAYIMSLKSLFKVEKDLTDEEEKEVKEIAKDTWRFFETTMTPINNYLAPDNIQENRRPKVVNRTSATNIGFSLLSIVNAYDLEFINLNEAIDKLQNVLKTIEKLEKWNGHLYNWYNIRTLAPLKPSFISTVDSGNMVASIYVVKEFLEEQLNSKDISNQIKNVILDLRNTCNNLIDSTDYTILYDKSKNIFSIGFDVDKNEMVKSYYDMLMSEARLTSLVAIASRQVTSKHWFSLARNLVKIDRYKGLLSWSGTSFEYFMPNLLTKSYEHTLIDESLFFSIYSQMKYGKKAGLPWGISESAFAMQDSYLNYQYKAFGVPWLGLKRGLNDSMVVSPYSSLMCMAYAPRKVYNNIKELKKYDCYSTYGFYEAIDFTKTHIHKGKKFELVKTYMAHHQGMILTALNNYFNDGIMQRRFHKEPNIKAAEILLKERVPMGIPIKENINSKYNKFTQNSIVDYTAHITYITKNMLENGNHRNMNIQTNGRMNVLTLDSGENYLYYNNYAITKNRYYDNNTFNGNSLVFTDKSTGNRWSYCYDTKYRKPDSYGVLFNLATSDFYRKDGDIETFCRVHVAPEYNAEIRKYTLINHSDEVKEIVINTNMDLAMCEQAANVIHPAFNNLKIEVFYNDDLDMLVAKKRTKTDKSDEFYTYAKLIGIDLGIECETEKTKLVDSNGKYAYSGKIANYPLTPVISYRARILLDPKERQSFYYVTGAAEDKYSISHAIVNLDKKSLEESYDFAVQKENVAARYLKLKQGMAKAYNKIIYDVLFRKNKQANINDIWNKKLSQSMLWKFSISGDLPIIQVPIGKIEDISLLNEVVNFMDYAKYRKIDLDIVFVVDEALNTGEPIKNHILKHLQNIAYMSYTRGNIYVVNLQNMTEDEKTLFEFLSKRTILSVDELKADLYEDELEKTDDELNEVE